MKQGFSVCLLILFLSGLASANLNLLLTVKDGAGAGNLSSYPVKCGVPLPMGGYEDINRFRVTDASGNTVPAQFDVLGRWLPRSNSIRVILVQFMANISNNGNTEYYLKDDGSGNASTGITIAESADRYTINAGKLKFEVRKTAFNLVDKLTYDVNSNGVFEASEEIISPDAQNGAVLTDTTGAALYGSSKTGLIYNFEETGPMRMVLKVESPTDTSTLNGWGFVCRLYAYYNQPFIRVDYYLKNSAYGRVGHQLYYNAFGLVSKLQNLGTATVRLGGAMADNAGAYVAPLTTSARLTSSAWKSFTVNGTANTGYTAGYADISDANKGVMVAMRNFSQMYPTELEITATKEIRANLWPQGRHRMVDQTRREHQILYFFHSGSATQSDLLLQAKVFQNYPVPFILPYWYSYTRAIGDGGGIFPNDSVWNAAAWNPPSLNNLVANKDVGWWNWGGNSWRRLSSGTGGMPGYAGYVLVCGKPAALYNVENYALHTASMRPMWMDDYRYPRDQGFMSIPYPPNVGMRKPHAALDSTTWSSWDDLHVWVRELGDYYFTTGERFCKDYLKMHATYYLNEGRQPNSGVLTGQQPNWTRGTAETMAVVVDAYKATGDPVIWNYLRAFAGHVNAYLTSKYCAFTGAAWHAGFMNLMASDIYFMLPEKTPADREFKERFLLALEGNANSQFYWGGGTGSCVASRGHQYYWTWEDDSAYVPEPPPASAYIQAMNMPGLMYFLMGDSAYRQSIGLLSGAYCSTPGKVKDFGDVMSAGMETFSSYYRHSSAAWYHPEMKRAVLPSRINDVVAIVSFDKKVKLRWTSVGGNEYRVHWAAKPIVEPMANIGGFQIPYPDTSRAVTNIYRANPIDVPLRPKAAGTAEEAVLGPFPDSLVNRKIYFNVQAVNVVSEADMARSPLSNIDSVTLQAGALTGGSSFTLSADYTSGLAPLTVKFGCTVNSGTAASYSWTFGDGSTSTAQNPSHTYTAEGTYTVACIVKDGSNNATSHSLIVNVTPAIAIKEAFAMDSNTVLAVLNAPLSASGKLTVSLTNVSIGQPLPIRGVRLDTLSKRALFLSTSGITAGSVYQISISNMVAALAAAPAAASSSLSFTADLKPNKFSARNINFAPQNYPIHGWETVHYFDGDFGYNYPRWSWGGVSGTANPVDSAEDSRVSLTGAGYAGATVFGEAWFKITISREIVDYRFSAVAGNRNWPPTNVSLKLEDSLIWNKEPLSTVKRFVRLDTIPLRITDGEMELFYDYLCYVKLAPVYQCVPLSFTVGVETPFPVSTLSGFAGNYPNPFNPATTLVFGTADMSNTSLAKARLAIFDIRGRLVRDLTPRNMRPNALYRIVWQGNDKHEKLVASGVYLARFTAGNRVFTRRLLMMK